MNRLPRLSRPRQMIAVLGMCCCITMGCRGTQYARVIQPGQKEMIGSHAAGQETFGPLIDEAVGKLLGRHEPGPHQLASHTSEYMPSPMRVCFVGVENRTAEELGDFKEQIYELISARLVDSSTFTPISRRYVDAGLRDTRLRPDELFVPANLRMFTQVMEQGGQPFDYLLFATLTSGTTQQNRDYQRDYVLTVELVDITTGAQDTQSATISKGYHHSRLSRAASMVWPWH